jgi:hypothetical protein
MNIPERLEDWTLNRVEEILNSGVCEDDVFDFKECLPPSTDDKGKQRLRKTIAAFANSGGGFLIYGVKDDRTLSPQIRLVGMDAATDFGRDFGAFPSDCQPSVEWQASAPVTIPNTSLALFVVEIFSTWRKPHAVMRDGAAHFMKRTNKGDEPMSFSEISGAFREAEFRRTGLALLISEVEHMGLTAHQLIEDDNKTSNTNAHPDRPWTWSIRYSTTLLDMTLGNTYPFIAADPALWKLLCIIRENARTSNARSEAFAGVVFFKLNERIEIHDTLSRVIFNAANQILSAAKEAIERLRKLQ